jgi:hypothetical protein
MACHPWAAGAKPHALAHGYSFSTPSGSDEKAGYIDLGPVRVGLDKRAEE